VVRFVPNGVTMELSAEQVRQRLHAVPPEPVQRHGVRVNGVLYPVKQAFEAATGVPRSNFISHTARHHLANLGFELVGTIEPRDRPTTPGPPRQNPANHQPLAPPSDWHTEAAIQAMVMAYLASAGWSIHSVADTAGREHGVDILAGRAGQTVAIEVKGYPSRTYADPARARQTKPTQPATQARHWYAQAILAAMLTRSRRPDTTAVIALPDFPTYRSLHHDTVESLQRAGIQLWWVSHDGTVTT
jgi:Holliday junction resolvase-like predicted endonuclease